MEFYKDVKNLLENTLEAFNNANSSFISKVNSNEAAKDHVELGGKKFDSEHLDVFGNRFYRQHLINGLKQTRLMKLKISKVIQILLAKFEELQELRRLQMGIYSMSPRSFNGINKKLAFL